ncbi:TIR domain-containing adapter molecule 1 [Pezoporus flaviventris]|uniref:TIR domain-containing adapter molecule 1 n=1 Tax=Pezoporus flaviventris TaxID=889875 RepID=UPI002AB2CDD2|nr:TIR domain-containing adapter molecule 1 [Pezoporus flaviventris]
MAQSTPLQPSFEDVLCILSRVPPEKLLSLKHKLNLVFRPSSKLLQAMILLALGQETKARICLDVLRDNRAAQYVHQTTLGAAGAQKDGEDLQPPKLDAGAMELLAQIYTALGKEKLCSPEAMEKACQAAREARNASKEVPGALHSIPPRDKGEHGPAASVGSGDKEQMLSSDAAGFLLPATPKYMVRSSPVQIGIHSDLSRLSSPKSLHSVESSLENLSFPSHLEISASPTAALHSRASCPEWAQQPDGDRQSHGLQEASGPGPSSQPAQVFRAMNAPQARSCHPTVPVPDMELPTMGAVNQPGESSDVSNTVAAKPQAPKENTDKKQGEKQPSTGLPASRAAVDTGPAHVSMEEPHVSGGIPPNSASASISTRSLPPPPTYSFASTLPPPEGPRSSSPYPLRSHSSPSPAWPPPLQTAEPAPTPGLDGGKFFTFVVLHASEDELVARRVKDLLENMGVPNGATLCENFAIAGRSHMTCFQDAMENSAFIILLLTKNFPCDLCMFQTNTVLMESIMNPSKGDSVIPFIPQENPLEWGQIPAVLGGLTPLDEKSPGFSKTVQNTFTTSRINEKKDSWDMLQRKKLQLREERHRMLQNVAALNLGSIPPSATQPPLLEQPPRQWWSPAGGGLGPARMGSPPDQPPSGHYNVLPGPGGIPPLIIQNARMVQIGNHNVMQVETLTPGAEGPEEGSRQSV